MTAKDLRTELMTSPNAEVCIRINGVDYPINVAQITMPTLGTWIINLDIQVEDEE